MQIFLNDKKDRYMEKKTFVNFYLTSVNFYLEKNGVAPSSLQKQPSRALQIRQCSKAAGAGIVEITLPRFLQREQSKLS